MRYKQNSAAIVCATVAVISLLHLLSGVLSDRKLVDGSIAILAELLIGDLIFFITGSIMAIILAFVRVRFNVLVFVCMLLFVLQAAFIYTLYGFPVSVIAIAVVAAVALPWALFDSFAGAARSLALVAGLVILMLLGSGLQVFQAFVLANPGLFLGTVFGYELIVYSMLLVLMVGSIHVVKFRSGLADSSLRIREDSILRTLIPAYVLPRVLRGDTNISSRHESVTIMFADLVDFTDTSRKWENHKPEVVIRVLDALFSNFDIACSRLGCEKIKTLGDGYMAAKGMQGETSIESMTAILALAKEFKKVVDLVNKNFNIDIGLRIGINSGPVISGVLGRSRATFDIWGKAVNIASRLEGHAPRNGMMMSEISFVLVKDKVTVDPKRHTLQVKGVGEITAFALPL